MDIPRIFDIAESAHRIHNPITPEKLATLGAALRLESGPSAKADALEQIHLPTLDQPLELFEPDLKNEGVGLV